MNEPMMGVYAIVRQCAVRVAVLAGFAWPMAMAQAEAPRADAAVAAAGRLLGASGEKASLHSHSVLVQDARTGATILAKNAEAVVPIASITKLVTAMVVLDSALNLKQPLAISDLDIDSLKASRSRLRPGYILSREELLLLALMSSENRAAAALARTYPGGTGALVAAMNKKAKALGMADSHFEDSSGLSPSNVSTARDLVRLVRAANEYDLIRRYTTQDEAQIEVFGRSLTYRNTNRLVTNPQWEIGLSKTGFTNEAGRCLVMQVRMASKDLVVVLLDSSRRIADARSIKQMMGRSITG